MAYQGRVDWVDSSGNVHIAGTGDALVLHGFVDPDTFDESGEVRIDELLDLGTYDATLDLARVTSIPASTQQGATVFRTDYGFTTVRSAALSRMVGDSLIISDDFMGGVAGREGWLSALISTGTIASQVGEFRHPGIVRISSNGATSAGATHVLGNNSNWLVTGEEFFAVCLRISANASNVELRCGFGDVLTTAADTDAVGFRTTGGTAIEGYTYNNGTPSATGSSFAYVGNTWYWLVAFINTSAEIDFYVLDEDGDQVAALGAISTNIPSGAGRNSCPTTRFWATSTTTRTLDIDCWKYGGNFARNWIKK